MVEKIRVLTKSKSAKTTANQNFSTSAQPYFKTWVPRAELESFPNTICLSLCPTRNHSSPFSVKKYIDRQIVRFERQNTR